ncbi:NACHT domain-containing protein [Nocardiopsis ansamitocini]|uniref:AAA+ ATPase domain-containing protein n=1 Tax=Nocardiopsis ansamitocini TaxID=1670832 RepID=A0A9W6P2I9_9ACTN|nr:ATP-binding protein [Nocardiopsis ansamitocini]GLU45848.1 hypothetical protein Nans01_01990 [Nocardiopsis ansamitocini]
MVKKTLSYSDALRILGKDDSALLDFAEKLADGTLAALGVPDLFGLRSQVVKHGRGAVARVRGSLDGMGRWERTERIEAANQVLRVVAAFEALEDVLARSGAPLSVDDLAFTGDEQLSLLTGSLTNGLDVLPVLPGSDTAATGTRTTSHLPGTIRAFIRGLSAWERLSATDQSRVDRALDELPELAAGRYAASYRRLAADIPEFGVWAGLTEHAATRERIDQVSTGLFGMEELLRGLSADAGPQRRLDELALANRAVLDQPMLPTAEAPEGMVLPTVSRSYLNPCGLLRFSDSDSLPSADSWWAQSERHEDLQPLLVSLLTQWHCRTRPIVLLGHPGAGKSQLTRMLCARLPAGDFLPLRVELRGVQADAPVYRQIEEGIAATLGTEVSWRELCDRAAGALPVVILDGFDELLQATGINRSDYLEQVQQFQEQQADINNPVAVIVTSRTVVADRTRFPARTPVIRLEPFDDARIARMLRIWNQANAAEQAQRGIGPLPLDVLLRYRELAEQPLLLLMLLIFDSDTTVLREAADGLGRGELYERLLTAFAERDVRKHRARLTTAELSEATEGELRRLEVVAMAMFTRHKQSVTADELDQDLAVLYPDAAVHAANPGLRGRITPADQVLGRFFFVHEARAVRNGEHSSVYEFLHATFSEYLVARTVVNALDELMADRLHARRKRFSEPLNDGLLYALTSFATLSGRAAIMEFTEELLAARLARRPEDRAEYRALLLELFADALYPAPNRSFSAYEPERLPVTHRHGVHTANLVLLLLAVSTTGVDVRELYPTGAGSWQEWRGLVGLWRSMRTDEWHGTVDTVRVRHLDCWGGEPRTVVERETGEPVNVGECVGFELRADVTIPLAVNNPYLITVPYEGVSSKLLRSIALRVNGTAARMTLMLLPYLRHVSSDLGTWFTGHDDEGSLIGWAEAHDILELRLGDASFHSDERIARYERLLATSRLGRIELLVLRQAAEDLDEPHDRRPHRLAPTVGSYLDSVRSVVSGPALTARSVARVLEGLRPRLPGADGAIDRITALAAANDERPGADAVPPARRKNGVLPSSAWGSGGSGSG